MPQRFLPSDVPLAWRLAVATAIGLAAVAGLAVAARAALPLGELFVTRAALIFAAVMTVVFAFYRGHHPWPRLGAANQVTMVRAGLVALLAATLGEPWSGSLTGIVAAAALLAVALDGVDGWLARRGRTASPFGARFDMETDALLILVLAATAWKSGQAGAWVLLSGLLRYLFVAAGWLLPWLRAPLPANRRRQAVCVVQMVALVSVLAPVVTPPVSDGVAAAALAGLAASFAIDVRWLWRERRSAAAAAPTPPAWAAGRVAGLVAALALLNASLAFYNVWPTPAIRLQADLAPELAVAVLALLIVSRWRGRLSPAAVSIVSASWLLLVAGRYADVTAPALYGRDVNLFWDLRHVSNVAAMLARAVPLWLLLPAVAAAAAGIVGLYFAVRWAVARVSQAAVAPYERGVLAGVASAAVLVFAAQSAGALAPGLPPFSKPVTASYARQLALVQDALAGAKPIGPSPEMGADLALVRDADVLLIFMESYGAVAFDRAELAGRLARGRAELGSAVRATNRRVASAYVESPTFGGSSWLAHLTLLSGVEVRDPDSYAILMSEKRDTLVGAFGRRGYRTVAWMPGLWQSWPEGAFYDFDDIYGGKRLGYRGPSFGWWDIPDQFALAQLDALEVNREPRTPLFAFFPTISTHTPFSPTPPYQSDWGRMLSEQPYDQAALDRAYLQWPDWTNLGPSYATAVEYAYASLAGYLRARADHDLVMILVGDHQPPAAVAGEDAPWDVPVHVISGRGALIERLTRRGFHEGLTPARPTLGRMHTLTPALLDAFSSAN